MPHPLNGFGFVVPAVEKRSILACTFSSVKFPGRAPEGKVLLRAFLGGAFHPQVREWNDERIQLAVREDLRLLLGVNAAPSLVFISRYPASMPQYHLGHLDRVDRIKQRLGQIKGLALAGNAYLGIGIPDCIHSGEQAADSLLEWLLPRP